MWGSAREIRTGKTVSWADQRGKRRLASVPHRRIVRFKGGSITVSAGEARVVTGSQEGSGKSRERSSREASGKVEVGSVITGIMSASSVVMEVVIVGSTWAKSSWLPVALSIGCWRIVGFVSNDKALPPGLEHVPLMSSAAMLDQLQTVEGLCVLMEDECPTWARAAVPTRARIAVTLSPEPALAQWDRVSRTGGHWVYGGVSTSTATVHMYWKADVTPVLCARLPVHHFDRLLRSVLGHGQMGKQCRADPFRNAACPGAVVSTRLLKHGLSVSGAGLFPVERPNTDIIVPCYKFGPRGWVKRQLTSIERAAVADIPVLHEHLDWDFRRICPGLLIRGLLVEMINEGGGDGVGVGFPFSVQAETPTVKRQQGAQPNGENKRIKVEPMPIPAPVMPSPAPAMEEADPKENAEQARKEKAVKHDDAKAPTHVWRRFLLLRRFGLVGGELDQTVVGRRKLIEELWPTLIGDEETRNETSRRYGDHLGLSPRIMRTVEGRVVQGGEVAWDLKSHSYGWSPRDGQAAYRAWWELKRLDRAVETLRTGMLRWWKRKVTRSFLAYWRAQFGGRTWTIREGKDEVVAHWTEEDPEALLREACGLVSHQSPCVAEVSPGRFEWKRGGRKTYKRWIKGFVGKRSRWWSTGADAVRRSANTDWWNWRQGSTLFYWRWPEWYRDVAMLGMKVHFSGRLTHTLARQPRPTTERERTLQGQKLKTVVERGYISFVNKVKSYTSFFSVPKGLEDIRMVYDASKSGLNEVLWVPHFPLPTIETHLRAVIPGTWMADLDVGEMFLNFPLHDDLRVLCGVDLEHYRDILLPAARAARRAFEPWSMAWDRCAMGLRISPYSTVRSMMIAEEIILGEREDPENVYRWDRVETNYPGSPDYDPRMPWVYKVRAEGDMAADFFGYVDDQRNTGPTESECWTASRQIGATNTWLGIQDAARKRREPSLQPGAWAGSIIDSAEDTVTVRVAQEKWDKARKYVDELVVMWRDGDTGDRKRLETVRGFLLYLTRTYPFMTPYIKGLHNTIDGWRPDRDAEGFRDPKAATKDGRQAGLGEPVPRNGKEVMEWQEEDKIWVPRTLDAPSRVRLVPRFKDDAHALRTFLAQPTPPHRFVRGREVIHVAYGFGDASGTGHASTFVDHLGHGEEGPVRYRFGQWCTEISEHSSNYRELRNLVDSLEHFVEERDLVGAEIFLCTDNSTAEAAFWKGNSSSPHLFELILRLKGLTARRGLILHVLHVSGKRMIRQGTDGCSRADFSAGVMSGEKMAKFLPLHLNVEERNPGTGRWFFELLRDSCPEAVWLDELGWFTRGHGEGAYLWTPPPAGAEVVVEQLGKARHKRPHVMHFVVAPRMLTGRWRKTLSRETDFYFRIKQGHSNLWPYHQREPLLIFVALPFVPHRPWVGRRDGISRTKLDQLVGTLCEPDVWEAGTERVWALLSQFLRDAWRFCAVSEGVV